ncbi:MAG: peptide chain release factor N(5)-glutamine methyltransferase [Ramlibacter sp.]|nr:peptide chain release factor N(5)-glutamine methyltransferase [Ramlibacter sp.]
MLAHDRDAIATADAQRYQQLCARRAGGEPLAYLVGYKEFFGIELQVDRRVLIPRPDTETLVEWALEVLGAPLKDRQPEPVSCRPAPGCHPGTVSRHPALDPGSTTPKGDHARQDRMSVIDLGTGSGAVALSVKKACPAARVEAVDVSSAALEVATANARALGLDVGLRLGSWLEGSASRYHLIVSNPPYVAIRDPHLAGLVHEPLTALASGLDGLEAIRAIIDQAPAHLHRHGWLLLEHGWDQAGAVRQLLQSAGFAGVRSRRDLAGTERCSGGQWLELG